jgi:hypothetical protein
MGRKHNHDPSQLASQGVTALDNMSGRKHNDSRNELHTCTCGALVVVPKGHTALDDDHEVTCHPCDTALGAKIANAF